MTYLKIVTTSFVVLLFNLFLNAQSITDYEILTFQGDFQFISGQQGPQGDDYAENYDLPFSFHYIDHNYSQIRICTNGWIELGSPSRPLSYSASASNEDMFSTYEPNKILAAWFDDLGAFNYPVEYTTIGTPPNRVFIIQWRDVNSPFYSVRLLNFQIRLYETTNLIEFWYGNPSDRGTYESASFGIEDHIGGSGHFIDGPTGSTTIGSTYLNSYDNWPNSFYRFIPTPIKLIKPNGGEFFSIGYTDTVKWVTTSEYLQIEYSTNAGNSWNIIENSVQGNTNQYIWSIPNTPTDSALIKLTDTVNDTIFSISNNVFRISEPPIIVTNVDSFYFELLEGDSAQGTLNLSNIGNGDLIYDISINYINKKSILSKSLNQSPFNWKEKFVDTRSYRKKNSEKIVSKVYYPLALPVVLNDPSGDGGIVDVIQIRGISSQDSIQLELIFDTEINTYDFGGILGFDIDQNVATGIPLPAGSIGQEVGCEFYCTFSEIEYNSVYLYDQNYNYVGSGFLEYNTYQIRFSFPISWLDQDDGNINIAAVFGNGSGPTDWIPDEGYGILGAKLWLEVLPVSGIVHPNSNQDLQLKLNTELLDGGEFIANIIILNNDPLQPTKTIPVNLEVIGTPNLVTIDSINFDNVYIGFPDSMQVEVLNNGSIQLEINQFISSNSVFIVPETLPVLIAPYETKIINIVYNPINPIEDTSTISILSNDLSSPHYIKAKGTGIYPPSIVAYPDSFNYSLNVGDSINTILTIDNSNGLGDLSYEIFDVWNSETNKQSPKIRYKKITPNQYQGKEGIIGINPDRIIKSDWSNLNDFKLAYKKIVHSSNFVLPLIVNDLIGDGGISDIKEIRGIVQNEAFDVQFTFSEDIEISDNTIALLALDIDHDQTTGYYYPDYYHDLGVEIFVEYCPSYFGQQVIIYNTISGIQYYVPYFINENTINMSLPLAFLNDDGKMDLLAISGYVNQDILDWAPNQGHVTLNSNCFWLEENPNSGIVSAGQSTNIVVSAFTSELIGGNYSALINVTSNDPDNPILVIPFTMELTGIPEMYITPDSLFFDSTFIGYPSSLFFSIKNTGSDILTGSIASNDVHFLVSDTTFSIPVDSIKEFNVTFVPEIAGIVNSSLRIISNSITPDFELIVSGEGIVAPNILTNLDHFNFELNANDSITSEFVIYNDGGSNLNIDITDIVVNESKSTERLFGVLTNVIYELDVVSGNIVNNFPTPVYSSDGPTGLAYSGDQLFFTDSFTDFNIYKINPDNGNLLGSFPAPSTSIDGLAYVDPYLYACDYSRNTIYIIDPLNGNIKDSLIASVYIWGGIDGGNNRLFASSDLVVYELNKENGSVIWSFSTINIIYGLGYTPQKIYTSHPSYGTDEYDISNGNFLRSISSFGFSALAGGGNIDAEWLEINPSHLTIPANDSSTVEIKIKSPDVIGNYAASIVLKSNDPDMNLMNLNVDLSVISGLNGEECIPMDYALYQNFPNPFNPETKIRFDIPHQTNVQIIIYDILGNVISKLVDNELEVGKYSLDWDATQFASGIYFCKIISNDFQQTIKMLLLK